MTSDHLELLESADFGPAPTPADNNMHSASDDKWWQESGLFTYGDPANGFGGEIRLGTHVNQGVANLYTWTVLDNEMIDRRFVTDQPLPQGVVDGSISGVTVRTLEPLSRYAIDFEHGDLHMEMEWHNFAQPVSMGLNVQGATLARGHYNAMGRITGRGRYRGQDFEIDAAGFSDHSWGTRRIHPAASRSLFCVFDEDFYLCAIPICMGDARTMVGYAVSNGVRERLTSDFSMGYSFRDDWVTPSGCDAQLIDARGRRFRLRARTTGPSSTQPMGHGSFVTHAVAEFECDGRTGRGILESSQFRGTPPAARRLGLESDSWWLQETA